MKLIPSEEQEQLRRVLRGMLAARSPMAAVRESAHSGARGTAVWSGLVELGAVGLAIPERFGGAGGGYSERAIVGEELGRALAVVPFLGSAVMAADVLSLLGDEEAAQAHLPDIASGERIVAVAVAETTDGEWVWGEQSTRAVSVGRAWHLGGTKTAVVDLMAADMLLVLASCDEGTHWYAVNATDPGVTRVALTGLDKTRDIGALSLSDATAHRLSGADALLVAGQVRDRAAIALGAEQLGVFERALELTVDYAKLRVQFGREVGSFQAVKFGLADLHCRWELAVSVLRHAAWSLDEAPEDVPLAAALTQEYVATAAFDAAVAMVQYHGGIGYTWEHDAHLYFNRALSAKTLLGRPGGARRRLAEVLLPG